MTYVIAEPCVDVMDRSCIEECPVDCIYEGERMLYIQPDAPVAALIMFPQLETRSHAIAFGALLGGAGGVITVVWFSVYGRSFGRQHLGAIQATAQVISVLASATGPSLLSRFNALTGSYVGFFYLMAPLALLLGGAVLIFKMPQAEAKVETCLE